MNLHKLDREVQDPEDLWFFGSECRWLYSKRKELIKKNLFENYSPQKLDSEIFNVNSKCSSGWFSNSYLWKYLGIKKDLRNQLKNLTIEEAINELKSQHDDDFNELIQLLEEIVIESNIVDNFLHNVFVGKEEDIEDFFNLLTTLIEKEKNLIIQGPSGVGKNYIAKNLTDSIIGERDSDFVEIIQFHEKYSYDYFVEGYIPGQNHRMIKKGIFYKFCEKARNDLNNPYFFIIDEMNRGNASEIFGDLSSLIDKNNRGEENKVILLYSQEPFSIPENVHIIGLLNSSNRSNTLMNDYAFRNKFSFFNLKPGFSSTNFKKYLALDVFKGTSFRKVIGKIEELNKYMEKDDSLGQGFCIGHGYFCNLEHNGDINEQLKNIIKFKIIPLLNEYWFDDKEKVEYWENELYGSLG